MQTFFHLWGLDRLLPTTPGALLSRIEAPIFLVQFGVIAVAGAAVFWFTVLIRPLLTKFALRSIPRTWAPAFVRVAASVAPPLLWLIVLWLAVVVGNLLGFALPLVSAGIALLVAWVCIRLLSFSVRSPFLSATISVVAWSIASLSILGLLEPLVRELDASAIHLGKLRLSAMTAINALFVLAALLWLTTILFRFLQRQISRTTSLTPSLQVLLIQLLQIFLPVVAVVIALSSAGIDLTAFAVVFGAVGLGVGLGLQRVVGNLVAGLTLLIGKSIKPGDIIEYKNSYGWVTAMGARYVTLRTRDGLEHLVPNDYFLENGVENWSHSDLRLRLHVPVGIAYDSDVHQAIALCIDAAKSVKRVLTLPEPLCLLKEFGDSSINLEIRMWIEDPRNGTMNVKSEVLLAVWDRFKAAGIKFPFPQRDVHIVSMPSAGGAAPP
ncbi:MAG: mechanosensitive ion channel domain-containing protein [Rhizomicrobium sp.]|jgi:small-conductance mechanosensitive channel